MIIIYDEHCEFQRCGVAGENAVSSFRTLDELYKAVQPDGIVLESDWEKITELYCFDFDLLEIW